MRAGDPKRRHVDAAALRGALLAGGGHPFSRPEAGNRRHSLRQGARCTRHRQRRGRRGCGPIPTALRPCMRWPARRRRAPIGCTQVTEILSTPGVTLVGPLPKQFELATVYTAGVCTGAAQPELAQRLASLYGRSGGAHRPRRVRFPSGPLISLAT